MSINPLDIMRSQEVSQYKQFETTKMHNEHLQINNDFQKLIKEERSKTTKTEKDENKEFRYDAKEKGQNNYSDSGKKKKGKKDEIKKTEKPIRSGGFDVLI